nr:MAG TPA: hypothetical protein [Caudoviricetes sp.]
MHSRNACGTIKNNQGILSRICGGDPSMFRMVGFVP